LGVFLTISDSVFDNVSTMLYGVSTVQFENNVAFGRLMRIDGLRYVNTTVVDYKIKKNTFCGTPGAISSIQATEDNSNYLSSKVSIKANNFCLSGPYAARIGTGANSNLDLSGNNWTSVHRSDIEKLLYDRKTDINIRNFINVDDAQLVGQSSNASNGSKFGEILPQCAASLADPEFCNQICVKRNFDYVPQDVDGDLGEVGSLLTFPKPIVASVSGDASLIQSMFKIIPGKQWEGHLKKYQLDKNGAPQALLWDAGTLLLNKRYQDRKIWSVGNGLASGINNLDTASSTLSVLRNVLDIQEYDDDKTRSLVNMIRGDGSYDGEGSGQGRWKLADSVSSKPVFVRPPSEPVSKDPSRAHTTAYYRYTNGYLAFKQQSRNRKSIVLSVTNDGMLHAFDYVTGNELWAFVPPFVLPKLKGLFNPDTTEEKTSQFLLDLTPSVQDVYDPTTDSWRTILVGGSGRAGSGYFALDITNTEEPAHVWSFEYDQNSSQTFYWNEDGDRSTLSSGYNKLSKGWSQPVILRLPIANSDGQAGPNWIAAFAGGMNKGKDEYHGSVIYIADLMTGKRLHQVDIPDGAAWEAYNSVPSRMTAITADVMSTEENTKQGAMIYFGDLEGRVWALDWMRPPFTDITGDTVPRMLANLDANYSNERSIFLPLTYGKMSNGDAYLFAATGDQTQLMSENEDASNVLMSLKVPSYGLIQQGRQDVLVMDSLSNASTTTCAAGDNPVGWKSILGDNKRHSSAPVMGYGNIYITNHKPGSASECALGESELRVVDSQCGYEKEKVVLGAGVATEATIYRGMVYLGLTVDGDGLTLPDGWSKKDSIIYGATSDTRDIMKNPVKVRGWWIH